MKRTELTVYPGKMIGNIRRIAERLPKGVKICQVIKADAYGHGAAGLAPFLEPHVDFFAVAAASEAFELRDAGIRKPILILGAVDPSDYSELVRQEIRPAVFRTDQAQALSRAAAELGKEAFIHIKLDTGMNRIGFEPNEEDADRIAAIAQLPGLKIEGLFSHFARADEADLSSARKQYERFCRMKALLAERGIRPEICHIANSAASMVLPETAEDMVRLGIAAYGLDPSEEMAHPVRLEPVAELRSRISFVKTVYPGEEISYGGHYKPTEPRRIATVAIGYADGYSRRLSGKGRVLVHGMYAPIRGNICMDQLMIDVTDIPDVVPGDTVTLIGRDGAAEISVMELAEQSGILHYEFLCGLSHRRMERTYVTDNQSGQ